MTDIGKVIEDHQRFIHKARGVAWLAFAVAVIESTIAIGLMQTGSYVSGGVLFGTTGVALWAAWQERRAMVRVRASLKQLTIIATIFLPLSFLTGFFGQNFAFLVRNIGGRADFVVFGIGLEVATVLVLLYFFRRRGWIGGPST